MTDQNVATDPAYQPRSIAESFLQNVVILDDHVIMSKQGDENRDPPPSTTVRRPDYQEYPERLAASDKGTGSRRSDVPLTADTVIDAFADLGMVCAVLRVANDPAVPERTVRAAVRADMVVLDWQIHESAGDIALDVLRRILADDQSSHRLRLIAIYTGEPDLGGIFRRVEKVIDSFYEGDKLVSDSSSRITKGPVRVVILAKRGTVRDHNPMPLPREVAETELPQTLVDEFGEMTSGLLRTVALAGITTIRENAHRVLARFDQTLDAAYLGHRILLPHPPDAEDHLVAALGSELVSILDEDQPGAHADIDAIEHWLNGSGAPDVSEPRVFASADVTKECLQLLLRGIDAPDTNYIKDGKKTLKTRGTELFTDCSAAATRSNGNFAALLSLKTRYPGQRLRLTIGTVVYSEERDNHQYLLCLQPKCDSVRLGPASGFPFLPLATVEDDKRAMSYHLVVKNQNGEWGERLGIIPKPSELIVRSFEAGPNPPGEVLAAEDGRREFYFEDVAGTRYRWVAEMKEEHAFRVAGAVASALTRPGPNDAEWLRRASRRPQ